MEDLKDIFCQSGSSEVDHLLKLGINIALDELNKLENTEDMYAHFNDIVNNISAKLTEEIAEKNYNLGTGQSFMKAAIKGYDSVCNFYKLPESHLSETLNNVIETTDEKTKEIIKNTLYEMKETDYNTANKKKLDELDQLIKKIEQYNNLENTNEDQKYSDTDEDQKYSDEDQKYSESDSLIFFKVIYNNQDIGTFEGIYSRDVINTAMMYIDEKFGLTEDVVLVNIVRCFDDKVSSYMIKKENGQYIYNKMKNKEIEISI